MVNLLKNIIKPITQIEDESVEFKFGFWKCVGALLVWQLLTLALNIIPFKIYESYTFLGIIELISLPILVLILSNTFGKLTWQKNTFKKFNKKTFLCLVLVVIVYRLLYDAFLMPIMMLIPESKMLSDASNTLMNNPLYLIISACIVAPIIEEIVFRGIVLGGMLKKYSPKVAITISALLFAILHGNIHQGVNTFLLGLILAYVYYKTRSIYLTIFCHFVNNASAFLLFLPETLAGIIINIFISTLISIPILIYLKKNLVLKYEENFISTIDPNKKIFHCNEL